MKFNIAEKHISKSQAKRISLWLEKFDIIILDFDKVQLVGQGFVYEVFRVCQNQCPDEKIKYVNKNDDILFMSKRSLH